MEPYFNKTEMVLAPIFDGGGMKVKIAEALSYGLPVVTTNHGNIGYELVDHKNAFIANTAEEFVKAIQDYYNMSEEVRAEFLNASWFNYKKKFSLNAATERCAIIINNLSE